MRARQRQEVALLQHAVRLRLRRVHDVRDRDHVERIVRREMLPAVAGESRRLKRERENEIAFVQETNAIADGVVVHALGNRRDDGGAHARALQVVQRLLLGRALICRLTYTLRRASSSQKPKSVATRRPFVEMETREISFLARAMSKNSRN